MLLAVNIFVLWMLAFKIAHFNFYVEPTIMLKVFWDFLISNKVVGVVCVTVENPAFSLALYLTGIHFRGEL